MSVNNVRAFLALCNLINIDTMKKIILLSICLTVSLLVSAVEVTTTFNAQSSDGKLYLLDSVKIENVTRGWSKTIDCSVEESVSYEVNETLPTGIDNIWTSSKEGGLISDYKNLIYGHSFSINVSQPGQVSLNVYDMLGRSMVSSTDYCSEGSHQYTLSLSQTQPFILSVRTANESAAIMLINMTNSGSNTITCDNTEPMRYAPLRQHETYPIYFGDQIIYIGYSHRNGVIIISQAIIIYQGYTSEIVTLIFEPAAHTTKGSYVGIMGFNNQIYSYPIHLLTNSNLSQYTSFINNLTTANGTILCHAVNSALDSIDAAPIPEKLTNVTLVTFTDGLDVGSWRMNSNYSSSASYLQGVHNRLFRTYMDGTPLTSYSIGIKGSDVTDEVRFSKDLHSLATDSANVYTAKEMTEVNKKFRDIAAKIYHSYSSHALTIILPAPEPDSRIRLTFDNVTDASQSEYYLEGTYSFEECGMLNNVIYCGVKCADGSTLSSIPDGMFDIFTINNLETNLGERIVASMVKQWYYVPSTGNWQINSEFTPSSSITITEDKNSAVVLLVMDCSSSLGSNFSSVQNYAKEFVNILAGQTTFNKPSVSSTAATLGKLSATCGGKITDDRGLSIIDKGICISEHANMDSAIYYSAGAGTDAFDVVVNGLEEGKTYYYHAYARNAVGVAYGSRKQFTAIDYHEPTVTTTYANSSDYTTAIAKGQVLNDGNQAVTERGICYSTSHNPTVEDEKIAQGSGLGEFSCGLTNLTNGTTYFVRAYAINSVGAGYGEELTFTTKAFQLPTVNTSMTWNVTYTSITGRGNVTVDGGTPVTEYGLCYSLSPNATIADNKVVKGSGLGDFILTIENLEAGTTYYARAFATNIVGTAYGEEFSVPTNPYTVPYVITDAPTDISYRTITANAHVNDDGGQEITERGICYSTSQNPTISDNKILNNGSTGLYSCPIEGLTAGTTYYIRAYAINNIGVGYGNIVQTATLEPQVPTVSTSNTLSFDMGIVCSGSVVSDNGADVIECGYIYSYEKQNIQIEDDHIIVNNEDAFSGKVTDFRLNKTYYVRAYAKNAIGIGYGETIAYTTPPFPVLTYTDNTKCTYTETADGSYKVYRYFETNVDIQCTNPLNFPISPIYYYHGHNEWYEYTPENIAEHAGQLTAKGTIYDEETDTYKGTTKLTSHNGKEAAVGTMQVISFTVCYGDTVWSEGITLTPKKK